MTYLKQTFLGSNKIWKGTKNWGGIASERHYGPEKLLITTWSILFPWEAHATRYVESRFCWERYRFESWSGRKNRAKISSTAWLNALVTYLMWKGRRSSRPSHTTA